MSPVGSEGTDPAARPGVQHTRATPTGPARHNRNPIVRIWSAWYFVVPLASLGFLAFVPFVHAAVRLRRPRLGLLAVVYVAFVVAVQAVMGAAPADAQGTVAGPIAAAGMLGMLAAAVLACLQLSPLRRRVYLLAERPRVPGEHPSVAAALDARERRRKARELAERDPLLARELRIGRPDLPHEYDDGGLVDLNAAPAQAISATCGIDPGHAEGIVALREKVGGLNNVDELFVYTDLPPSCWERIRDRGIVLPA
jgi:DNA uptake protein ComE-like DNA-binding protein